MSRYLIFQLILGYLTFLSIFVIKIFILFDVSMSYKAVYSVVKLVRGVTCEYTAAIILSYGSIISYSKCILNGMHTHIVVNNFDNFN